MTCTEPSNERAGIQDQDHARVGRDDAAQHLFHRAKPGRERGQARVVAPDDPVEADHHGSPAAAEDRERPTAGLFAPLYGPGSAARFAALAPSRMVDSPNLMDDVDTVADLERLEARLGPHTRSVLAALRTEAAA